MKYKKGFTLIELLVTMVIFVLLTSVVLFSQKGFNNSILLNNLTYDVALTIKQAQTYGVSVKEFSPSGSVTPFPSYGVYFDMTDPNLKTNNLSTGFIIFANPNSSGSFFNTSSSACLPGDLQCIQKYNIRNGSFISSMCVGSGNSCDTFNLSQLVILFKRPKPDAIIYAGNSTSLVGQNKNYAKVVISSAAGATSSIVITNVGQIYVSK